MLTVVSSRLTSQTTKGEHTATSTLWQKRCVFWSKP